MVGVLPYIKKNISIVTLIREKGISETENGGRLCNGSMWLVGAGFLLIGDFFFLGLIGVL